jgi:hypothetical protein
MPRSRAEIKAELQVEAERLIEALLDWSEQTDAPDMTAIEDQVLKLRQAFGEKLAEGVIERQPAAAPLTVTCPTCGRAMHPKKKRQRRPVESRVGSVALQRAYYYCDHCRVGLFPPGSATESGWPGLE